MGREIVMIRIPSRSAIDTPIAEISEASRLAPRARNLRYATNSTSMATIAQAIIAPINTTKSVQMRVAPCSDLAFVAYPSTWISK